MISIEELKKRARTDTITGLKGEALPGTTEQLSDGVIVAQYHPEADAYTFILNGHPVTEDWLRHFLDDLRKWTGPIV